MRVRTILLASFWVAVFLWVGYNGMQAIYSYFQTNDLTEQAFTAAWERQRQRNPSELFSAEFLADLRSSVLMGARRAGIAGGSGQRQGVRGGRARARRAELDLPDRAEEHLGLRHRAAGAALARAQLRSAARQPADVLSLTVTLAS